jgi:hypothetical protein
MATRSFKLRGWIAMLGIAGLVVAATSWIGLSYLQLARQQVELAMASAEVEAASRARVGLVTNLLHSADAFACLDEGRRDGIADAASRAGRARMTAGATLDLEAYGEFLTAQQSLSAALEGLWPAVEASGAAGASLVEADLRAGLERAGLHLTERIADFDRRLERHRRTSERFPGSLVAGLAPEGSVAP